MVDTQTVNLSDFFVGQDYNRTYQLLDGTTPVDITGYTWEFLVRAPGGTSNLITKAMSITTAASGLFAVNMDPTDTDDISENRTYVYQVQGTTSIGEENVYVEGEFEAKTTY